MIRKTYNTQVLPDAEAKQLFEGVIKSYPCNLKGKDVDEERTITIKISSESMDRSKDVVSSKGAIVDNFINNPVVAGFHDYHEPAVGRAIQLGVGDNYIISKMEFTPKGMNPKADVLFDLYKSGFMSAASIGFIPVDGELNKSGGYDYKTWELLEYSLVLVPDQPEALTVIRSKGLEPDKLLEEQKANLKKQEEEELKKKELEEKAKATPEEKLEVKEVEKTTAKETMTVEVKLTDVEEVKKLFEESNEKIKTLQAENEQLKKSVEESEQKGLSEVINLAYTLSDLSYLISWFEDNEMNQPALDKLKQAQVLIMEVIKDQAEFGKKEVAITRDAERKAVQVKAGRTISSKHEEMLKDACDHMGKSMEQVQNVLNSATPAESNDGETDAGKSVDDELFSIITVPVEKELADTTDDNLDSIYDLKGGEK